MVRSLVGIKSDFDNLQTKINTGSQIELKTSLTTSGHYVHLERVTENGIYVNDPYGWHQTDSSNYETLNSNSINTNYGGFNFIPGQKLKNLKLEWVTLNILKK